MIPFRLLKVAFPSPVAAILAIAAILVELTFGFISPNHAFRSGGLATATAVITTLSFWVSVTWIGHWCLHIASNLSRGRGRLIRLGVSLLSSLLLMVLLAEYIVSWGSFLQTRRFLNWEAVLFSVKNIRMIWLQLAVSGSGETFWSIAFLVILLAIIPFVLKWIAKSSWKNNADEKSLATQRMGLCLGLIVAAMVLKMGVENDLSIQRRVTRLDSLSNCLNPSITLASSILDSLSEGPIEACLDTHELIPISEGQRYFETINESANITATKGIRPPSVLVIAVEALRATVIGKTTQGREITPNINAIAKNGIQFTRAYSQSTHSDYSDVVLPSSLYPLRTRNHHYYQQRDPWPKTLIYDVLKKQGYSTAIISAQNEKWGGMDAFLLTENLDIFYHPETSDEKTVIDSRDPGFWREHRAGNILAGKFTDAHTTDVLYEFLNQQSKENKPFYACCTFQSSHFPYALPKDREQPFQPATLPASVKFSSYPPELVPNVRNAYYNAVHESDRQVGRIVEELRKLNRLNDTILIVTGENGEAFQEHGETGHACVPVEPAIHVAAVIHFPANIKPAVVDYPLEHVDLAPTILGQLGLPSHPNFQGIDLLSDAKPLLENRLVFFHVHSPIARADAVMLAGRWKFMTSHKRPDGVLYDLKTDPEESRDFKERHPELTEKLERVLEQWRNRQLAYYHHSMYYTKYFPPKPPKWKSNK